MRALLFVGTLVCLLPALSWAATLWTGPMVSFSKANFANPALAENQDRLTAEVWITRGDQAGLFNAALRAAALLATAAHAIRRQMRRTL